MLTVQLGAAASVPMFTQLGAAGTAWLRLSWAALFFVALVRPPVWSLPRQGVRAAVLLGVVSAAMTLAFFAAIERIPLGVASALEFLGPLGVAVAHRAGRPGLVWPALAGAGVLGLTEPWNGTTDLIGVGLALIAAVCWAAYIVITQRVGDALAGLQGLAISMPAAALAASFLGAPQALPHLTVGAILLSAGLALLLPVIPYALELIALRRLTTAAFGTLTSLEPALALLIGLILLQQRPAPWQLAGVALVVVAGVGAQRHGQRQSGTRPMATPGGA
jgi:inner membrane transporter RhtA